MKWITAEDLKGWASRQDARALLSALVADLIRASAPRRPFFRFPSGESSQLRGFDGDLESDGQYGFVPNGRSKWEFGTSEGHHKAESDYTKRTDKTPESIRRDNTLVLVTPHSWDTPRETLATWLDEKRAEGRWKDVSYLDGVSLEHWLDEHPAVAARYAREILKSVPKQGVLSTDEFWDDYRVRYDPALTEAVVLADRQKEAGELLAKLAGSPSSIVIGAESEEDLAVFAVSAIRSASQDDRFYLEARALIVETAEAATFLAQQSGLIFIVLGEAVGKAGSLSTLGPTVMAATGVQRPPVRLLPGPGAQPHRHRRQGAYGRYQQARRQLPAHAPDTRCAQPRARSQPPRVDRADAQTQALQCSGHCGGPQAGAHRLGDGGPRAAIHRTMEVRRAAGPHEPGHGNDIAEPR